MISPPLIELQALSNPANLYLPQHRNNRFDVEMDLLSTRQFPLPRRMHLVLLFFLEELRHNLI